LLKIVQYPHPTLRWKSKPLRRVDAELQKIVRAMFDCMYEARGVGLAANQVDLPYRLFVANLTADPNEPDQEQVFINPVLSKPKGQTESEEGCLSLPGLYAEVMRPERITLNAYNMAGQELSADLEGLLARVVQHETDHLDGVLFVDRLSPTKRVTIKETLDEFETVFDDRRRVGEFPDDATVAARLEELERMRC
jgi:peptide deformylase